MTLDLMEYRKVNVIEKLINFSLWVERGDLNLVTVMLKTDFSK